AVEAVQAPDDLVDVEAATFQVGGSCAHVQVSFRGSSQSPARQLPWSHHFLTAGDLGSAHLEGGWGQRGVHRAGAGRGGFGHPEAGGGGGGGKPSLAAGGRDGGRPAGGNRP